MGILSYPNLFCTFTFNGFELSSRGLLSKHYTTDYQIFALDKVQHGSLSTALHKPLKILLYWISIRASASGSTTSFSTINLTIKHNQFYLSPPFLKIPPWSYLQTPSSKSWEAALIILKNQYC